MSAARWPALSQLHTLAFDFDGVFTDNTVYVDQNGVESVRCSRADSLGLDLLRAFRAQHGLDFEMVIVSRERNPVVAARAAKLRLPVIDAVIDKVSALEQYLAGRGGLQWTGLLFAGNDVNDLPLVAHAGFFVAPGDAHPFLRKHASAVLPEEGGAGFVRALVEKLLNFDALTPEQIRQLVVRP